MDEANKVPSRDRIRGCLLGGAIGDALGAPIEFDSLARIRHRHGPDGLTDYAEDWRGKTGLITDDTQMTLFTVEGLIRARVRNHERGDDTAIAAVRDAYLRWLDTQDHTSPPRADGRVRTGRLREQTWLYSRRAPGNACLSGLRTTPRPLPGNDPPPGSPDGALPGTTPAPPAENGRPGAVNPGSKGCGTVMRSAPFGLAIADPREAFRLSAGCAQITHGHPTGYLAAGAFAAIIRFLTTGEPMADAVRHALDLLAEHTAHEETTAALHAAVNLAAQGAPSPSAVETLGGAWIAEEALAIAVYCALVHESDMRRALLLAVNHSGDSDSTGAICGNLLGTRHGEAALPLWWLSRLEGRDTLTELSDDLATHLTGGTLPTGRYPTP